MLRTSAEEHELPVHPIWRMQLVPQTSAQTCPKYARWVIVPEIGVAMVRDWWPQRNGP